MKKYFCIFVLLFMCIEIVFSQTDKTNKEIKKGFKKQREFALDVDLSNTIYSGMNYEDFAKYMNIEENIPPKELQNVLNKYKYSFYSNNMKYKYVCDNTGSMAYRIHIKVLSISEKAGIQATAIITYKDVVDIASLDLSVNDGRWNKFAKLLEENQEKQRENLDKLLRVKDMVGYYIGEELKFKYLIK